MWTRAGGKVGGRPAVGAGSRRPPLAPAACHSRLLSHACSLTTRRSPSELVWPTTRQQQRRAQWGAGLPRACVCRCDRSAAALPPPTPHGSPPCALPSCSRGTRVDGAGGGAAAQRRPARRLGAAARLCRQGALAWVGGRPPAGAAAAQCRSRSTRLPHARPAPLEQLIRLPLLACPLLQDVRVSPDGLKAFVQWDSITGQSPQVEHELRRRCAPRARPHRLELLPRRWRVCGARCRGAGRRVLLTSRSTLCPLPLRCQRAPRSPLQRRALAG